MAALRTFARRVAGIDKDHRHACQRRFAGEEHAGLSKGPAMQNGTLQNAWPMIRWRMLVSSSNTMACFVRRASPGDLLGYYVIGVGGKAGVPARKLLAAFAWRR